MNESRDKLFKIHKELTFSHFVPSINCDIPSINYDIHTQTNNDKYSLEVIIDPVNRLHTCQVPWKTNRNRETTTLPDKRHLNEYINQRRIKNPACTVQALPFIPRQARSPFTPIESRPFSSGDSRFFRFVESCYTYTYSPNRGTGHKSLYLVVVFPER